MTTYWAELDTNNVVTQVITGVDDLTKQLLKAYLQAIGIAILLARRVCKLG